jgi:hypothetical protein
LPRSRFWTGKEASYGSCPPRSSVGSIRSRASTAMPARRDGASGIGPSHRARSDVRRGAVAPLNDETGRGVRSMMKRAIIFALVLFGALAPMAGIADAHWDTACQCDEIESP